LSSCSRRPTRAARRPSRGRFPKRKRSSTLARAESGGSPTPRAGDPVDTRARDRQHLLRTARPPRHGLQDLQVQQVHETAPPASKPPCRDPKPFKYDQGTGRRQVGWLSRELCAEPPALCQSQDASST
jgi:hypothetical protein